MRIRGILSFCALAAATVEAPAQTFTLLHVFHGPDGADPSSEALVQDSKGNLYSATCFCGASGYGTVYEIDAKKNESVLHSFTNGADGGYPWGVVFGLDGALYGIGGSGGTYGWGTAYRITTNGQFTSLYQFQGGSHASQPVNVLPYQGALYGNAAGSAPYNAGTLFKLDQNGETDLYKAVGGADGSFPQITASDGNGNFYGISSTGGDLTCNAPNGCGVVFKLDSSGAYSVLHVFENFDGSVPAGVTLDSAGNLYGTTGSGGAYNSGTVFLLNSKGQLTTLYSFTGGADGGQPQGGVVRDPLGNLYGTTYTGGISTSQCYNFGCGVVYMLAPSGSTWKETVLHSFNGADGDNPTGNLLLNVQEPALYGTTWRGGDFSCTTFAGGSSCGVVFKISR